MAYFTETWYSLMVGFDEIRDAHNLVFLGSWMFLQKLRNDPRRCFHHTVWRKSWTNHIKFLRWLLNVFVLKSVHFDVDQRKSWMVSFLSRDLINFSHWRLSNWTFFSYNEESFQEFQKGGYIFFIYRCLVWIWLFLWGGLKNVAHFWQRMQIKRNTMQN